MTSRYWGADGSKSNDENDDDDDDDMIGYAEGCHQPSSFLHYTLFTTKYYYIEAVSTQC